MDPETLAFVAYVAAVPALALACAGLLAGRDRVAALAVWASVALLAAAAAVRWTQTGHPPIFGTHENALTSAWALALTTGLMARGSARRRGALPAALLAGFAVITLVYGMFFARSLYPLTISERSLWVDLHVLFAWIAYAELMAAVAIAAAVLLGRGEEGDERRQIRRLGIGFAAFTAMLAVGAYYSFLLFAEWYQWEMVESVAAAAWLGLGVVMHGHLFFGWRGRKLASAVVCLLPFVLLTFWVWSVFSGTYHYFEIPAITPGGF